MPDRESVIPSEALAFFAAKGIRPSFDYRDVWREEHAQAFTVAKAMQDDVLTAIKEALQTALAEGQTLRDFQGIQPLLEKLCWWGIQDRIDPLTGEERTVQLGSPRRLRLIYRANMRTARAAGQWHRAERTKQARPYLLYQLGPSREHREEHVSWAGLILPIDHPWWRTHFPPNGWECKCRVRQISQRERDRLAATGNYLTEAPALNRRSWVNKRTGEIERVPKGIDPGWDANAGISRFS